MVRKFAMYLISSQIRGVRHMSISILSIRPSINWEVARVVRGFVMLKKLDIHGVYEAETGFGVEKNLRVWGVDNLRGWRLRRGRGRGRSWCWWAGVVVNAFDHLRGD